MPGGFTADYLLYDPHTRAVWVPAGSAGAVFVVDTAAQRATPIAGFATAESERNGKRRVVGPSSAALGDGVVYIGNRADASICAFADATLAKGACATLDSPPDGLAYAAGPRELWATTPRGKSIQILDGATLQPKASVALADGPEGIAVDAARGRLYTNVNGATLAIDLATRQTVATWAQGCGPDPDEPHGIRVDEAAGWLLVACSVKVQILDAKAGTVLGSVATGSGGIDDIDYDPRTHTLYAAASGGTLTIARIDPSGAGVVLATIPTAPRARNGVVDDVGRVYLANGSAGELLVVTPRVN